LRFRKKNGTPVVGIREGAWLVCEDGAVTLKGEAGARIFKRGEVPVEAKPGDNIIGLVGGPNANGKRSAV
jgi:dipeptidase E